MKQNQPYMDWLTTYLTIYSDMHTAESPGMLSDRIVQDEKAMLAKTILHSLFGESSYQECNGVVARRCREYGKFNKEDSSPDVGDDDCWKIGVGITF